MKIIIEGCDGVGKTTLAHILCNKYHLDYCHCGQYDPSDFAFYKNTMRKENVVWDRHTIGEMIYPDIFKRTPKIDVVDLNFLMYSAKTENVKILVLTCDEDEIIKRLNERGNEHPSILANIHEINHKFISIAKKYNLPVIDTSKTTLTEIFNLMEEK